MRGDMPTLRRALTDLHELRAWWAVPIIGHKTDIGGGFELRYVGRERVDKFEYTTWDEMWRIGGRWSYSWLRGDVSEMISLTKIDEGVRVTIEQTSFESFRADALKIFGYHKTETSARLERLQAWLEQRVPANMGQIPLV
jgi:hypothetical protein